MSISDEKCLPRSAGRRPKWARVKFFQCSLVTSDVLWKAPSDEGGGAEEVLAAFFYQVPAGESRINLGVQVVCKSLTLYLVLDGMPNAFLALKQVCLAYGGVTDVPATGDSGCVVWSDSSIQRILRYDRVDPHTDDLDTLLRYARFVRYMGKPTFAELDAEEDAQSVGTSTVTRVGDGCDETEETESANKIRIIQDGAALEYGGKAYVFGGKKRWQIVRQLIAADGDYAECGKGMKAVFVNTAQAKAFYVAAVEAEGIGRKGTGRYRLKI